MIRPGEVIDKATLCRRFGVTNTGGIRHSLKNSWLVLVSERTRMGCQGNMEIQ